jgi:hypothetical protein
MELILPVRPLDGEPEDVVVDVEMSRTVNDLAWALARQLGLVESMPQVRLQHRVGAGADDVVVLSGHSCTSSPYGQFFELTNSLAAQVLGELPRGALRARLFGIEVPVPPAYLDLFHRAGRRNRATPPRRPGAQRAWVNRPELRRMTLTLRLGRDHFGRRTTSTRMQIPANWCGRIAPYS